MIPAVMRLEVHSVLRQRWFAAGIGLCVAVVGFFTLVAAHESAVIGFTGFGRVMGGVVQAALLFVPLLALFSTTQAVTVARQDGVLEWYLSYPNSRARAFWAMFLPRVGAVIGPLAVAVLCLGLASAFIGEPVPVVLLAQFAASLAGQAFCFAAMGMFVSVISRSPEQALLRGLLIWMACAVLVDFVVLGLLLRWELPAGAVFALAGVNPIQAGRIGLLAGIDAELGVLGPVGTWATTRLGPTLTITYGLVWPILVGAAMLAAARVAFNRRDVL